MAVRKIIEYPSKLLRERTVPVSFDFEFYPVDAGIFQLSRDINEREFLEMIRDLEDTLEATSTGLALAANQIGIPYSIVCVKQGDWTKLHPLLINPKIEFQEGTPEYLDEGCLSFPKLRRKIQRNPRVILSYVSTFCDYRFTRFERQQVSLTGLESQMIQHEIDHLQGRLFVDDIPSVDRQAISAAIVSKRPIPRKLQKYFV